MKFSIRMSLLAGAAALPLMFGGQAEAAPCLTSDVNLTINYPPSVTYSPSICADNAASAGNPTNQTNQMKTALGLSSLTYFDTSATAGSNGTALGGIAFTVTAPLTNNGTWTVSWVDNQPGTSPNLPAYFDLAVLLFGGNNASAYLLTNVLIPVSPNSGSGWFDINFLNNGGQQPNLSHMILAGNYVGPGPTPVPEPATLALLGAGLLGLGLARRRRRAA